MKPLSIIAFMFLGAIAFAGGLFLPPALSRFIVAFLFVAAFCVLWNSKPKVKKSFSITPEQSLRQTMHQLNGEIADLSNSIHDAEDRCDKILDSIPNMKQTRDTLVRRRDELLTVLCADRQKIDAAINAVTKEVLGEVS